MGGRVSQAEERASAKALGWDCVAKVREQYMKGKGRVR